MAISNEFIIDRVRRVTEIDLVSNDVNWTLTQIESPQVEFTGESTDKTDAFGTLIARFDTTKGVTFSGEGSLLSIPMMASQLGADVQTATAESKVQGETFEVITVDATAGTLTLKHTPSEAPDAVYVLGADKNITGKIAIGAEGASISGKVVTLPEGNYKKDDQFAVLYKYETDAAVKIVDSSDKFAEAAKYIVEIRVADVCNPTLKRDGYLVFPKAKIDNNFSVGLTTEGTHPFSFSALKDYCDADVQLCYWIFVDDED